MIDLEVLENGPVITVEIGDELNESEIIRSPSKLSSLDRPPHAIEELDVEGSPVELLKLVDCSFESIEPPLRIFEKVAPVRIRNEGLRHPPMIDSVEACSLNFEDGREKAKHVTVQVTVKVLLVRPSERTVTVSPAANPGASNVSMTIEVLVNAPPVPARI